VTGERHFRCLPESVTAARHFVRASLADRPAEIAEIAELLACELATNCVRHARTDFDVVVLSDDERIRIEVRDSGRGGPVLGPPVTNEQSGRGLRIVQDMSEAWGIVPSRRGKTVWFTLAVKAGAGLPRGVAR
jgi:anti-sigma regulatory factor (Ser/Thr protein kinase)